MDERLVVAPCIFRLPTNIVLFQEGVDASADIVEFDLRRACLLSFVESPTGLQVQSERACTSFKVFWGTILRVPKAMIIEQNTINMDLLSTMRRVALGLEFVPGPRRE